MMSSTHTDNPRRREGHSGYYPVPTNVHSLQSFGSEGGLVVVLSDALVVKLRTPVQHAPQVLALARGVIREGGSAEPRQLSAGRAGGAPRRGRRWRDGWLR